ncbi:MAG: mechanosensitive ion channel family protein [Geminicoccaceae bacterium]
MRTCIALLLLLVSSGPLHAQGTDASAPPAQVQQLLELLRDPAVKAWLDQRAEASAPSPVPTGMGMMMSPERVDARLQQLGAHLHELVTAIPQVPGELEAAGRNFVAGLGDAGPWGMLLLVLGFVGLGFLCEAIFWRVTSSARSYIVNVRLETAADRLRAIGIRLAFSIAWVGVFALGSVGAFLMLDWPPLLRAPVLGYLMAFVVARLAYVLGRFFLAPGAERFRIVPMPTPAAWFWFIGLTTGVTLLAFGWISVEILFHLGVSTPVLTLIADALSLSILIVALVMIWRWPHVEPRPAPLSIATRFRPVGLTVHVVAIWLAWALQTPAIFWTLLVLLVLPALMLATRGAISRIFSPAQDAAAAPATPWAVVADRAARALLLIGAVWLLASAWGIDLHMLTAGETVWTRLLRGALNAVVIVLVADLLWQLARTAIDQKLGETAPTESGHVAIADTDEARRQARIRTLLPILRNVLFIVLIVMAMLMALSSLGVEIGPLVAGAGVVGVAIGFGAQTLVKDVISGMFFLLDDAFRVGEYIVSGSIRGTVESFSLRSVKLRHHRGPLHTVPFGSLNEITNYSRDWVIDKISFGVTYDTDLDKVKRVIKQVSKDLMADPEISRVVIEPLKFQGVQNMGDFAIQIRVKIKTRPGEQFVVRRTIYDQIKKAFEANGIHFAFLTVTVAGDGDPKAAVARSALQQVQPPVEA